MQAQGANVAFHRSRLILTTKHASHLCLHAQFSLNRQKHPDLCFKCKALLLGQLCVIPRAHCLCLLAWKKKERPIISENVNVSTQEMMVSSQPTGLIFPLSWIWFLTSFLGKSSAVIFLLPAKEITSLHPPVHCAFSSTFPERHTVPCIGF